MTKPVRLTLSTDESKIFIRFAREDLASRTLLDSVKPCRWDRDAKAWSTRASLVMSRRIVEAFGHENLDIDPDLQSWARTETMRQNSLFRLSQADDGVLHHVARQSPVLDSALRGYQRAGAHYIKTVAPSGGVLVASDPRTGKTPMVIAGVLERNLQTGLHLVVCPTTAVADVWGPELRKWHAGEVFVAVGSKAKREAAIAAAFRSTAAHRWLVVNHNMVDWNKKCLVDECPGTFRAGHHDDHPTKLVVPYPALHARAFDTIIADESHLVLGSARSKNQGTNASRGLFRLRLSEVGLRIAITGTPFGQGGRVKGLFGTLAWLAPADHTSYWAWADDYLNSKAGYEGRTIHEGLREDREREFARTLGSMMIRRTREEVMPWLEGKVYEDVYVDMMPSQAKQYREMLSDMQVDDLEAIGVLAQLTRLKQFANAEHVITQGPEVENEYGDMVPSTISTPTEVSCKIPAMMQRLEKHGINAARTSDKKALIFTQFAAFATVVIKALRDAGIEVVHIVGADSQRERSRAIAAMQTGTAQVCVLTTQTGGTAITLDRASVVVMLDERWTPGDNTQAEERAITTRQDGNTEAVHVYYIRSNNTIDEAVRDMVFTKTEAQHAVLDERRGREWIRRALTGRPVEEASA